MLYNFSLLTESYAFLKSTYSERIHNCFKIRQSGQAYFLEWRDNCLSLPEQKVVWLWIHFHSINRTWRNVPCSTFGYIYFFCQWKKFGKRFCELVLFDKIDIELHSRNAYHQPSCTYQFSAPIFKTGSSMLGRKLNFQLNVMILMLLTMLPESAQHSTAKLRHLSNA